MGLGTLDYVKLTIFGLAMTALWSSLHSIILPLRLIDFVPETEKATYLTMLTVPGLVLAILVQPMAGLASDRSASSLGRRRPFILFGGIATLAFLPGIALAGSLPALFAIYYLMQLSANTALGPYLALIPDRVPEASRGRAAGVKGVLEIIGAGVAIWVVGNLMGNYATGQGARLWLSLGILAALFLGTLVATMLLVREKPGSGVGAPQGSLRVAIHDTLTRLPQSLRIDARKNPGFVRFLFSRLFFIMPLTAFQAFGLYFFRDYLGVASPASVMGNFTLVSSLTMLGSVYPFGRLADRLTRRLASLISGIIAIAGIGVLFLNQSQGAILAAAALMGIGFGGLWASNWALAVDLAPRDEAGKYIGLTNLASAGGSALARLQGPLIDYFNSRSFGFGYEAMLVISLASLVASVSLSWGIRKQREVT